MNLPTMPISAAMVPDESDPSLVLAMLNERVKLGEDFSSEGNDGTPTDVVPERVGSKFNAATSTIDCNDEIIGAGDVTFAAWFRADSAGESGGGRIADNAKFFITTNATEKIVVTSTNGASAATTGDGAYETSVWTHLVITRTSAGIANIYINGVLVGGADQDTGTPAAGTTNLFIGNRSANDRTFDGCLHDVRVYTEIKALKWIKGQLEMAVPA